MRRKLFGSAALVLGLALVTSPSAAQQFDPEMFKLIGPVFRVLGSNPATLLNNPSVQTELKLDDDQKKAVQEMNRNSGFGGFGFGKKGAQDDAAKERMTKMMDKVAQLKDVPEDKLEDKIREVFKEEIEKPTKETEKILKPDQLKRLHQIGRQNAGVRGLVGSDTAKELKLTDEQTTKIKGIATEMDKDVAELMPKGGFGMGGGGGFNPEAREKIANLRKEAMEKAQEALTADQKAKWKELTGEPFEMKFNFGQPRKKKDD